MSKRRLTSICILVPAWVLSCGCASAGSECADPPAVESPPDTGAPAAADAPVEFELPALASFEPSEATPAQVRAQFGRLVGEWSCVSEARQPDGSFKPGAGPARWTFFYTLGAQAVGDVFEPPAESGAAVGMNLRVYDPDRDLWVLAWTTPTLKRYDHFEARQEGDTIVMRGEIAAKGPYGDHAARITFFDISAEKFEWRYEAANPGTDGPWQEYSRIHCVAAG